MTLLGTFVIGEIAGAIILHDQQNLPVRDNHNDKKAATEEKLAAAQEQQMQQALED